MGEDSRPQCSSVRVPHVVYRRAFTLVETAVVFAIVAILAAITASVSRQYIQDAKVKQTRIMMRQFKWAMDDFAAARGELPPPPHYWEKIPPDHLTDTAIVLPPTYTNRSTNVVIPRTDYYRSLDAGVWTPETALTADVVHATESPVDTIWALPDLAIHEPPGYEQGYPNPRKQRIYGIQLLYYCLMREPEARQILNKMPEFSFKRGSKLTDKWANASDYFIGTGGSVGAGGAWVPNLRRPAETQAMLDAWERPLYYGWDHFERKINRGEPYLQSAGPDGLFDTGDDIFSFKE